MKLDRYLNRAQIMERTGRKRTATAKMLRSMQALNRYPPEEIIWDGNLVLVHENVLIDWLAHHRELETGGQVPPYRRGI